MNLCPSVTANEIDAAAPGELWHLLFAEEETYTGKLYHGCRTATPHRP